jgi:hypothetical protein
MEKIQYNLIKNQNNYPPILASEYNYKGKSSRNKLRPEACPAIYQASSKGILFYSEADFYFNLNGDHTINIYNTLCRKTGKKGREIVTPALLGSSENGPGYFKIGNGLNIKLGKFGGFVLPPIDPRLKNTDLDYSIAYLPPFYCGQLVAAIRPLKSTTIKKGEIIGQLILLSEESFSVEESSFENIVPHFENDFLIYNDEIITTTSSNYNKLI